MASISVGLAELVEQEVNRLAGLEVEKQKQTSVVQKATLAKIAMMNDDKIAGALQAELANLVIDKVINKVLAKKVFKDTVVNKSKLEFVRGTANVVNRVNLNVAKNNLGKSLKSVVSERSKMASYNRMAKRQINIYANQIKKEGLTTANAKLKNRAKQILNSERGYYQDQGKVYGAREVNQNSNKTAMKKWVHGMYGEPNQPRDTHVAANGQLALIDGTFFVNGENVQGPREFKDISQNINCHCGIEIEVR